MKFLYSIPGMEDVEDVIVSSGPNTWPNWRNFSDRIIQPGDIVFMDLAAFTWNGYKSCYYRTYCVGKEPSQEQKDIYSTALEWLYDSIDAVKAGTTTREIASKWPSAKEAWGYAEEDQAAANLWGHGLGLAQYNPPVISRIWSLDHPIEIKSGMVFALETQHGKLFRWGVRIEEMLIVHDDESRSSPTSQSSRSPWSIRCRVRGPRQVVLRLWAPGALALAGSLELEPGAWSLKPTVHAILFIPLSSEEATDATRFGPKAANLAALGRAGLRIPEGVCLDAAAYRHQVTSIGLDEGGPRRLRQRRPAAGTATCAEHEARSAGAADRSGHTRAAAGGVARTRRSYGCAHGGPVICARRRSVGSSFAGQFESYLGLDEESEFVTAVRSCWTALWSTRALRYMASHDLESRGHGHGRSRAAAGTRTRGRGWTESDGRRRGCS